MTRVIRRRVVGLTLLAGLGLCTAAGRLVQLGITEVEADRAQADRQSERAVLLPARRGALHDRHGRVLASTLETLRVEVWPPNLRRNPAPAEEQARRLGDLASWLAPRVGAREGELLSDLTGSRNALLGRPVSDPAAMEAMEAERLGLLRHLDLVPGAQRRYPWRSVGGNLLGYVDHAQRGVAGLEQGLEETLAGQDGARRLRVDHRGREVFDGGLPEAPPLHGSDVTLSIDIRIQQMLEEELTAARIKHEARRAFAVALDSRTGQVLGLASVPGLDPDDGQDRPVMGTILGPVQEVYPPGSTFKPLMMALALELGLVTQDSIVDCRSERGFLPGRRVKDTQPQERDLGLEEVIVHSSNIGMASIFMSMVPADRPKDTALMAPVRAGLVGLGFGARTGIPLPAEADGRITPLARWARHWTLASVSFGQEISVTALQLAAAMNSLRDGVWREPQLILGQRDGRGSWTPAAPGRERRVFSREHADLVRGWMASAVREGQCREVQIPSMEVAGKTGTADSEVDLSKEIHSYAALAPASDPEVALVVVLSEPSHARYSSQSAAPTAGRILQRLLPYLGHPLE